MNKKIIIWFLALFFGCCPGIFTSSYAKSVKSQPIVSSAMSVLIYKDLESVASHARKVPVVLKDDLNKIIAHKSLTPQEIKNIRSFIKKNATHVFNYDTVWANIATNMLTLETKKLSDVIKFMKLSNGVIPSVFRILAAHPQAARTLKSTQWTDIDVQILVNSMVSAMRTVYTSPNDKVREFSNTISFITLLPLLPKTASRDYMIEHYAFEPFSMINISPSYIIATLPSKYTNNIKVSNVNIKIMLWYYNKVVAPSGLSEKFLKILYDNKKKYEGVISVISKHLAN